MTPEIEALYPKIGQELVDLIPEDFVMAWISVEMIDDVYSIGVFYSLDESGYHFLGENLEHLGELFRELRQRFKDANLAVWSTVTFQLSGEGRMNMDVGYEDVSDFGLSGERRDEWIAKYLGENARIAWT